jgi:hypothetical protein
LVALEALVRSRRTGFPLSKLTFERICAVYISTAGPIRAAAAVVAGNPGQAAIDALNNEMDAIKARGHSDFNDKVANYRKWTVYHARF